MEKKLYQLSERGERGAFFLKWSEIPSEVLSKLKRDDLETLLSYSTETKSVSSMTAVFFKSVKKFKKGITTQIETGDIIYGI